MKTIRILQAAAVFCVIGFAALLNAADTIGSFTMQTVDGKTVKSEALKGMPLVVNFASPW